MNEHLSQDQKCFACDRRLERPEEVFTQDTLSDRRQCHVLVGPECFRKVESAGAVGYQPLTGGPRLYFMADDARAAKGN